MSGPKCCTNLPLLVNLTRCFIFTNKKTDAEHTIELLRSYRRKYNTIKRGKSKPPQFLISFKHFALINMIFSFPARIPGSTK